MRLGCSNQFGRKCTAGLLALLGASYVHSQPLSERVPEFFLIEDAFMASSGEIEGRSILQATRLRDSDEWDFIGLLAAERGFGERVAIGAALPWKRVHTEAGPHSGIGDVSVELLYDVFGRGRQTAFLIACELILPTGDESAGLGEESVSGELKVVLARNFGALQLHVNLGAEFSEEEESFIFGASLLHQRDGRLVPTLEFAGEARRDETELYIAPGAHWRLSDAMHIGAAVPIGITNAADRLAIMAMLNVDF
jgi:hypothetical protein